MRAKLYNRVAVTALAGIPRGQPSSKLTSKRAGTPRRWLRALQCRSDAPSMSVPGQRWSDRERLGSSMLTDIGGAAHTNTSHSSQLNPMSPTRCSATLDIFEVNFDEGCSFENVSLLVLPILRSDFQLSSCDASAPPLFPEPLYFDRDRYHQGRLHCKIIARTAAWATGPYFLIHRMDPQLLCHCWFFFLKKKVFSLKNTNNDITMAGPLGV